MSTTRQTEGNIQRDTCLPPTHLALLI